MNDQYITLRYVLALVAAVLFTWLLHEFTHWLTSELLGYESILRLNTVSPIKGQNPTASHKALISASGPVITIIQAVIAFVILNKKGWNKYIYPFLFVPLYMRVLAGFMNFINPNDEGRLGEYLGIGIFTISVLVSLFLFILVYRTSKKYKLTKKLNVLTVLFILIISSILILSDQFLKFRIL